MSANTLCQETRIFDAIYVLSGMLKLLQIWENAVTVGYSFNSIQEVTRTNFTVVENAGKYYSISTDYATSRIHRHNNWKFQVQLSSKLEF